MYLIDSDILIDHLRQKTSIVSSLSQISTDLNLFHLSTLSEMEIWSGQSTKDLSIQKQITRLLSTFHKISPDSKICQLAGELRRDLNLTPVDAIIAATAVVNNFILLTRNIKHYQSVNKIKIKRV